MDNFFEEQKFLINSHLQSFLRHKKDSQKELNRFGSDFPERLGNYIMHGKIIRGSLCVLGYQMVSNTPSIDMYKLAAAVELYHSGLLIHDDIIDQDTERRNQKSMHIQYQNLAEQENMTNPPVVGMGLGISAGDITFFFALECLANLNVVADVKRGILNLFSREFVRVGLMEMQDIFLGSTTEIPTEADILKLYTFKTGRYTFSLPLITGAMLAGADEALIKQLENIGETFGIIYQLLDDKEDILEKNAIKGFEFKKSLYYPYLMSAVNDDERQKITNYLSHDLLAPEEYTTLISLLWHYAIPEKCKDVLNNQTNEINRKIETLSIADNHKILLHEFVTFLNSPKT